jgi:hypothetical protein
MCAGAIDVAVVLSELRWIADISALIAEVGEAWLDS